MTEPATGASGHDPFAEMKEVRDQLSASSRRLVFFFGAGTSQAVGLTGLPGLTTAMATALASPYKEQFAVIRDSIGGGANLENVLDVTRICRELLGNDNAQRVRGLTGEEAKKLDREICRAVYTIISGEPPKGLDLHFGLASWLQSIERQIAAEIFTTNYDLLFERGLEEAETAYFDGFIGSVAPFFSANAVEFGGHSADSIPPVT